MASRPKLMFSDPVEIRKVRKKLGLNQAMFWERVGITQSGGSRYETGRDIPLPVLILLNLAYAPEHRAQRVFDAVRGQGRAKAPDVPEFAGLTEPPTLRV